MRAVTLGYLGNQEFTKEMGKKSTESDIALYSFKEGDVQVSAVVPLRYPEKPQALAYAVQSADAVVFVIKDLTKEIGEQILAVDAAGIEKGVFVLQNFRQPEEIKPLIKGTTLERFEFMTDEKPPAVRAALAKFAVKAKEGPVRIPVDHHFDVKGIGTVVLGFVKQGECKKHQELRAYPTPKMAIVRSIQVHDVDVDTATTGDHVGLALKNISNEEVDRGFVFAPANSMEIIEAGKGVKVKVTVSKFYKNGVKADGQYMLALGMQFVPARAQGTLAAGQEGEVEFLVNNALCYDKGTRGVLFNLDNPAQRVVGSFVLPG